MQAKIEVFLKPGVLDVQGKAIEGALSGLGFGRFSDVRVGRLIVVELQEDDPEEAERDIRSMCDRLLVNSVIETFEARLAWNGPNGPLAYAFSANKPGAMSTAA